MAQYDFRYPARWVQDFIALWEPATIGGLVHTVTVT
jgi:hypothetical protein